LISIYCEFNSFSPGVLLFVLRADLEAEDEREVGFRRSKELVDYWLSYI